VNDDGLRPKSLVAALTFGVAALVNAILFADTFVTKIMSGDWFHYAFLTLWGVSAIASAVAARDTFRRARRRTARDKARTSGS
jgi:hypothetical protein